MPTGVTSDRLAGTLLDTALGDALRLPCEGMSARSIARRFGRVDRCRIPAKTGFVSDDTEQSALVAQSLARHPDDVNFTSRRTVLSRARTVSLGVTMGETVALARKMRGTEGIIGGILCLTTGRRRSRPTRAGRMIEKRTLRAMAVGSGLAVANIYYAQPLLADMGRHLGVLDRRMGLISMLSQVGYATGMLLFLPLGDRLERRSFILAMLGAVTVALLGVAAAPSFAWLAAASLAVGVTTITPQLLVPFAAHLAEPAERGRVVGTVMSGLLIGILAARTVSGVVGGSLGWRTMYGIAAAVMVALALSLKGLLPRSQPEGLGVSYLGLLRSIGGLLRDEPVLRQSCLLGAMSFGAFSAFWTTLAFHLARPPFGYGSGVVGLFGLVGIVGALAAPLVGRFADRRSPRWTIGAGLACILLSYSVLYESGGTVCGMVVGVILLDLGAQSAHVSNQSRIYAIRPEARSRMNTAYMVAYFVGGALGSYGGAWGWDRAGWGGVCLVGLGMTVAGLIAFVATAGVRLSGDPISIGGP